MERFRNSIRECEVCVLFYPIIGLFMVIFKIILSLNKFYRFIFDVIIGDLFLKSLVLCFKPTSD